MCILFLVGVYFMSVYLMYLTRARVCVCVCVVHWHCTAQLSMFNMEKRFRNKIIIIIIIIFCMHLAFYLCCCLVCCFIEPTGLSTILCLTCLQKHGIYLLLELRITSSFRGLCPNQGRCPWTPSEAFCCPPDPHFQAFSFSSLIYVSERFYVCDQLAVSWVVTVSLQAGTLGVWIIHRNCVALKPFPPDRGYIRGSRVIALFMS